MERFTRLIDSVDLEDHGFDADEVDEYAASILKDGRKSGTFPPSKRPCVFSAMSVLFVPLVIHTVNALKRSLTALVIKFVWTNEVAALNEAIDVSEGGTWSRLL